MTVNFRTLVSPLDFRGMINHSTPMLSLGSCFAANIGSRLEKELFDAPLLAVPFVVVVSGAGAGVC